jgi:aspartokinase-like uncharacterized kinase
MPSGTCNSITPNRRDARTCVVKIGGASVFSNRSDVHHLREYLDQLDADSSSRYFMIVGGGETVESMRTLHRTHPQLDPRRMHWRCVDLLSATCDAAAELLGLKNRIASSKDFDAANESPSQGCYLVDVRSFYQQENLGWIPQPLVPTEDWETTSDTLAWLLALRLAADELQLIKKPDCSSVDSLEQAVSSGLVDPQMMMLSRNQPHDWKLETVLVYHTHCWNRKSLSNVPLLNE